MKSQTKRFDLKFFYRKKVFTAETIHETKLDRVLGFIDLTALGVACTLGSGAYVLIGPVVVNDAGPSIILSFLIAAIASFISGLSYAELGARVPRSGSAYVYIYVTIGEFIAFIIGWDVILEYVIGTSSTASALSLYIDSLVDNKIQHTFRKLMPINISDLGQYPDFLAFSFALAITVFLIIGVRESAFLNKIFTIFNLLIIILIIISGGIKSNLNNWFLTSKNIDNASWIDSSGINQTCNTTKCGSGGFLPFGFNGVVKGAATCFYAFIGFDCIATTGEEVHRPHRTIPLSIIFTLLIVLIVSYIGVSIVVTLMIPYYMLNENSPFSSAFNYVGLNSLNYAVTVGAILSIITCLYASMFPMPRVVYSMASDGLIFKPFSYVLSKLKTPIYACLFTGIFSAIMSLLFDLNELISMMSIGTLMAYSLVSACVIILRYRPDDEIAILDPSVVTVMNNYTNKKEKNILKLLFMSGNTECNKISSLIVNIFTVLGVINIIIICLLLNFLPDLISILSIVLITLFSIIFILITIIIYSQPQNKNIKTFKIPFVPFLPMIAIFTNIYLMTQLDINTWIRFILWFCLGMIVYISYGIRFSLLSNNQNWFPCVIRKPHKFILNSNSNDPTENDKEININN